MVRAILEGRKTQTRRIVKPQPDEKGLSFMRNAPLDWRDDIHGEGHPWKGETANGEIWRGRVQCWPGDRLWVRETWMKAECPIEMQGAAQVIRGPVVSEGWRQCAWFKDSPDPAGWPIRKGWKPSIHMPRWASRITLEVVSVRVERLENLSESDAVCEGVANVHDFIHLWTKINGSWEPKTWVWVVQFRRA